jgi:hypothetical protein
VESAHLLDRWLPPEGAGRPVACVATSFVFEPDFFEGECLSRFLGFDGVRGETNEIAYVIEEEERLAEARVSAIVDRSQSPGNRNLRWDLLAISPRRGLLHAKVTLLVWERFIRIVVGSANLTRAGYRSNVEVAATLEAYAGSELPASIFLDVLAALEGIVRLSPGDPTGPGPEQRAFETLAKTRRVLAGFELRGTPARGAPRLALVIGGPSRPVLPQLLETWSRAVPRRATVLSPFYDTDDAGNSAAVALAEVLARTGDRWVTFVLPTDQFSARTTVRAPRSLASAFGSDPRVRFQAYPIEPPGEPRRLHAKTLILESVDWVSALVGSSNFTAAGYGLSGASHIEVNLAIGASVSSDTGKSIGGLIPEGEELDIADVNWEVQEDEDEQRMRPVPWGFLSCLADAGPPPRLILKLEVASLPSTWSISTHNDVPLTDDAGWRAQGRPEHLPLFLPDDSIPFWVKVRWHEGSEWLEAGMPVNVIDPGKLPPPLELRSLPIDLLLRVLASTRPIYDSIAREIERREQVRTGSRPEELDPLKRYSAVGQLLGRARRVSAALEGLRRRLEQPVGSLDTLRWRLFGPIGPKAIAEGLLKESEDPQAGFVRGEASFILAELTLTLRRVDWRSTLRLVDAKAGRGEVRKLSEELARLRDRFPSVPQLDAYVDEAFAEALR